MIKAVSFDIGGTLVKKQENMPSLVQVLAQVIGQQMDRLKMPYRQHFIERKISFHRFLSVTQCKYPKQVEQVIFQYYQDKALPSVFPDVTDTLIRLKEAGLFLMVLSNKSYRNPFDLAAYGLKTYFDAEIYSHDAGCAKPATKIFRIAQEVAGVKPQEMIHIGDSLKADVLGAKAVGWQAVYLQRSGRPNHSEGQHTMDRLHMLSKQYAIPQTDILLISLNRYGVCADMTDNRTRFKLKLDQCDEVFYMAVCVNTYPSPFTIEAAGKLCLGGVPVGQIFDVEKDTCDTTYFRRNRTELTLNSNMRSQCKGCTFCGTYNLDPEDKIDLSTDEKIAVFIEGYLKQNQVKDLSDLVRVTICTGCFLDEMELVGHIRSVRKVFEAFGFKKRIRYIGSQIRSAEAMNALKKDLPFFSLSLTVECFSNRAQRMRDEKASLNMEQINDVLVNAMEHGFSANYLYIVGLDELDVMKQGIVALSNSVNRLPLFQIMQNYVLEHEAQRVEQAKDITYYLEARQAIEAVFDGTGLKPRSWENYRGLFYTAYQNRPFHCIRI